MLIKKKIVYNIHTKKKQKKEQSQFHHNFVIGLIVTITSIIMFGFGCSRSDSSRSLPRIIMMSMGWDIPRDWAWRRRGKS